MNNQPTLRALVLSGGSIKGAFQAGAVCELLRQGFAPDAIYGISVGALNGAFLAHAAGRAALADGNPDWPAIGQALWDFWRENVTEPKKIARRRRTLKLAYDVFFNHFQGLTDTRPLQDLVHRTLSLQNLRHSPVIFKVGMVNLTDGRLIIADPVREPSDTARSYSNFIEYVIASTAIPVVMPVSVVNGALLTDGGVRDVALVGQAVKDGASELVCVLCQPPMPSLVSFNHQNLLSLASRLMEIVVNETVNNDLETALWINRLCPKDGSPAAAGPLAGKRRISLTVIRPAQELAMDLDKFDQRQILEALEMGKKAVGEKIV